MCEQDSSGIQFKAPLEYLTWPDLDTGNRPDDHDLVGDQFVVRVEEQHAKMLRPLIGENGGGIVGHGSGGIGPLRAA